MCSVYFDQINAADLLYERNRLICIRLLNCLHIYTLINVCISNFVLGMVLRCNIKYKLKAMHKT